MVMRNHLFPISVLFAACMAASPAVQADPGLAGNDWCRIRAGTPVCNSIIRIYGTSIEILEDYPRENSFGVLRFRGTLNGRNIIGAAFTPWPTCGSIKSAIESGSVSQDMKKIEINYRKPTKSYYCDIQQYQTDKAVFIRKQW